MELTAARWRGDGERPWSIGHGDRRHGGEASFGNTVAGIRQALEAGLPMVEVDVQLARDGRVVMCHDDLGVRPVPEERLPSLDAALREVKRSGARLLIELKAPSPARDPGDRLERPLAAAVVAAVRRAAAERHVLLESFSPALLQHAGRLGPELGRVLALNPLQLLRAPAVAERTGLPVRVVHKRLGLGLRWAEVGRVHRMAGYPHLAGFIETAGRLGAEAVSVERSLLRPPERGRELVRALREAGLRCFAWTVDCVEERARLGALGVDAVFTDRI